MRLTRFFLCLLLLIPIAVMAQTKNPAEVEPDLPVRGGTIAIPDDGYDGTLGSMACVTINETATGTVQDADVEVSMEHTFVGDLTIKLVSPAGTIATVLSRPGLAEPADDGTDCCGNSSNLELGGPITFSTTNGLIDAETMGEPDFPGTNIVVCTDDGECSFIPSPDSALDTGDLSAIFDGEEAAGNWQLCVGDSAGLDTGNLADAVLDLDIVVDLPESQPVPTMSMVGLVALMLALGGLGIVLLSRRKQA